MKKLFYLLLLIPLLFTGCKNNVHSEYEGYEYVISEKEDYYSTYSIFGEKATDLIIDAAKEQIGIYYVSIFTKEELRKITNEYSTIMNIIGKDVFDNYYLGISQRTNNSLYALGCVYNVSIKYNNPNSTTGWVDENDFYKSLERYYPNENKNIEIKGNYILDIFLYPKDHSPKVNEGLYSFLKLEEEYHDSFITTKDNVSYLYNKRRDTYDVYKVDASTKVCNIAREINNKNVNKINSYAFFGNQFLDEIIIPSSITTIEEGAFSTCYNLKRVIFEEGCNIELLPRKMFYACGLLEEITIPSSVTIIGEGCFYLCISLETINFSEQGNLKEISMMAFSNCTSLREVYLPNGLETLDDNAFYNTYLNLIEMPSSLVNVGIDIFAIEGTSYKKIKVKIHQDQIPSSWYMGWDNGANIEVEYIK